MAKITTDAAGRKFDENGKRVYDKAGPNTWVEAVHRGTYPANHLREPGSEPFQLKEGDAIVDWMREVEPGQTGLAKDKRKAVGGKVRENKPRNQPEGQFPNGTEKPDGDPSDPATLDNSKDDGMITDADLA